MTEPPDPPPRRRRAPRSAAGPRPLSTSLDAAVARLGSDRAAPPAGATALGALFSRWDEIAGAALAGHVWPLELTAGTLLVAVDHPAWATQVRSLSAELLARVGSVCGTAPSALKVVVRPGKGPA